MSDEINEINSQNTFCETTYIPPEQEEPPKESLLPGFKSICLRIGVVMIITFASRLVGSLLSGIFYSYIEKLKPVVQQLIDFGMSAVFLNFVPIISAVFILKHPFKTAGKRAYEKPKYLGRALAMFPAGYGAAIAANILTVLLGSLFAGTSVGDSFGVSQDIFAVGDTASAWVLFVQAAIFAPIFEELWFRGLIMESLRPYGNGVAIFISAILFGLTHANFSQFFYATVLGIFLGYLAVSTGSIVTTTIVHAMFNSIAAFMTVLAANPDVQDYVMAAERGAEAPVTAPVVAYIVWLSLVVILMLVGGIMAIFKLVKIRRYKVPKVQTELSASRRWGIFFSRPTVIITLVLAADAFLGYISIQKINELIIGG